MRIKTSIRPIKKNKVSIIIPTYNRRKSLLRCLNSILGQKYKNFEIIIVDDGSTDNSYEYIGSKFKSKVKYIKNSTNRGINYSRNMGIVASEGEYVLFLDSDCEIVNKEMIMNMIRAMKATPNVGTLGGFFNRDSKRSIAYVNELNDIVYFDLKDQIALKKCDVVAGCNFLVKRELLYKFKGFDDFIVGDSDEVEFNLTLIKNGYVNLFGPSISVTHYRDKAERDNLGIQADAFDAHTRRMLRILYGERNYLRYLLKNVGFRTFLKAGAVRLFSVHLISTLAFVKQSFFGYKDETINTFGLKSKMVHFVLLLQILVDPIIWNLLNFYIIKRCKDMNFLENKQSLVR